MEQGLGFAHFLAQTDAVGRAVLVILLLLSVASWYLIVTRTLGNWRAKRHATDFETSFDAACLPGELPAGGSAFARLVGAALSLQQTCRPASPDFGDLLTRSLNNAIDKEMMRAEHGLTLLATTGSAAPYIGLFGTVWGIYHALVQIGMSGQGTLDKVAGPVGEALIMTALGLAVAIPAVLAYNAFQRRNRIWLNRLESFAHQIYLRLMVDHGQG